MNGPAPPTSALPGNLPEDELLKLLPAPAHKAVLVMDLVESVRLMAADERAVVSHWQGFVQQAHALIPANGGRVVKSLGDGLLAEFEHSRDAVKVAHRLHRHFDALNATLAPARQMLLRAGINATHLFSDAHDVYGHGVNLAARVAGLALPGHTVITSSVRDALVDGMDGRIQDMGENYLKHWQELVHTWYVHPLTEGEVIWRPEAPEGTATDFRPSIAIVPFEARNPTVEHFVIGELIADGVITQLAGSSALRVVSRLSTTAFRGRQASPGEIDAQLDAAFVLSGSYATLGDKLIIMAELTDTRRQEVVWAERLGGDTLDLMEVQSELIGRLSAACSNALLNTEIQRAAALPVPKLDSNALMLGGITLMHRSTPRDLQRSRELLEAVADRHGRVAAPWAWLAKWHIIQVVQGATADPTADFRRAIGIADRALDLEPGSSLAMAVKGHAVCHLGQDVDGAHRLLEAATQQNPNDAMAWLYSGLWSAMWGQPADAVSKAENALRLSPLDPQRYYFEMMLATSYLTFDTPEKAVALCRASLARNRFHLPTLRALITSAFEANQMDEAREAFNTLIALQPDLTVASYLATGGHSPLRLRGARAFSALGMKSH